MQLFDNLIVTGHTEIYFRDLQLGKPDKVVLPPC